MKQDENILEYILGLYFHVEHGFTIEDVDKYVNNLNAPNRKETLKKQLRQAIIKDAISPMRIEDLTGEELETQEEVNEFLINEIWKPLYGDEPIEGYADNQ